jgi:hypothetical protein
MAVEAKRGCGFRKVGGLYLVAGKLSAPCCKLPFPLNICPCCGQGIKQTRGWTWVDPGKLMDGACKRTEFRDIAATLTYGHCPCSDPKALMGDRAGLLWIGRGFYPTPEDFMKEGAALGVSRRISTIPRGFEVGKTWILFAHLDTMAPTQEEIELAAKEDRKPKRGAGVFQVFRPERIERIVKQSEYDRAIAAAMVRSASTDADPLPWAPETEELEKLLERYDLDVKRGISWVPVPDDDKDHQGGVYDEPDEPQQDV